MTLEPDKNPTAICLLVTNIDAPTGGTQKNSWLLLREFQKTGIQTYACVRNYYGLATDEIRDGVVIHRSKVIGKSLSLNGLLYLIGTFAWLIRNRNLYDLIHCQQMFGPTMAATVASYFIRRPVVTRVTTVGDLGEVRAIKQMPLSWLRLRLIKRVSRWVALTGEMKAELMTLGIAEKDIDIIYNSTELPETTSYFDDSRNQIRDKLGIEHAKMGIFVGRLSEEKNIDVLIRAWSVVILKHPDAHLLILGAGGSDRNVEKELRELVVTLNLGSVVHFLGHKDNVKDYILASDMFILPTRTEGMSNALVEAFACGVSIIASDIKANAEICVNEVNSLLVEPGNVSALTDSILRLLDEREFANRLGKAARKQAEDTLSVDTMVAAYLETYKMALRAVN